jgi:hypothetical protein
MAKETKPMISKRGFGRKDKPSHTSNKNDKIYDEIAKQFDIYEFLDVNDLAGANSP